MYTDSELETMMLGEEKRQRQSQTEREKEMEKKVTRKANGKETRKTATRRLLALFNSERLTIVVGSVQSRVFKSASLR